ncbi:DUF883 domain-containing protein [Aliiglaciecola sp. 3_MG-2023]|uniref:DUF883 domain-containing protein n=1 Tax=Aliiglaciecola sp. 3_MG-2023 TaxID=3062644 RepID=UPI0026E3F19F|nr:DUF883 domain-containing protein [Aliiglaciecola sp. 3_MG-2023]MDO6692725.1 DUF883 domain-containing protein [Aliiglaciecola sp. 3_MG-2023]
MSNQAHSASNIPKQGRDESDTPIADKVTDALHHSVDSLSKQAAKTEEKVRHSASASAEAMSEKQQEALDFWNSSAVGKFTKENPVATAGIAFAAGMALTALLKRK